MKKTIFTLLFVFSTTLTLMAQNGFKTDILSLLQEEGYAPSIDNNGFIAFKMQDNPFLCSVHEAGDKFALVKIITGFRMETLSYEELLGIANEMNYVKFGCKCCVFKADGNPIFQIATEFITASRANSEFQIKQTLQLMPTWIEEFEDTIGDK